MLPGEIDVKASVRKRRVVYRRWMRAKIEALLLGTLAVQFLIFPAGYFWLDARNSELGVSAWVVLGAGMWLTQAILYEIVRMDWLKEYPVSGDARARVQALVVSKGWNKLRDRKTYFIAQLHEAPFSSYELLTVIYAGSGIFVNTAAFSGAARSPLHGTHCRRISDRFAAELAEAAAPSAQR